MASKLVTIDCEGEVLTHLPGVSSDYATMCGLDGDDPREGQRTNVTPRGSKVNCDSCYAIWLACKRFRSGSFNAKV